MKKLSVLLLACVVALAACKKDDDEAEPVPTIGAVPSTFGKKVMVEENTGSWCGWCVLGAEGIKTAQDAHPGKVNPVALHGGSGEPMTVPEYSALLSFSGATGVPHYQLNRGTGGGFPGSFQSQINSALSGTAQCGLAIDAKESSGNNVVFTVHAGFNAAITGDFRLVVYIVEDDLINAASSYDQENYVSGDASYPSSYYYSQPSTIHNFQHKHVARKMLSGEGTINPIKEGDQIPAASVGAGKEYVKTYTFTVPSGNGWNTSNLSVIVGIMKYAATCSGQQILNSQRCELGTLKNWD